MDTSYLSQQVTTIIERLHGFFDEIGVPSHERDSRESELFSALSETLHNQLNLVAKEKHELTEEAQHLIKTIRQMERSIDDSRPQDEYDSDQDGLKVTFPLLNCIKRLKEKHHTIAKLHRERFEQVRKLVEALESYASHLEPSFVKIKLPPSSPNADIAPTFDLSPTYVSKLDNEFTRVYEEYNKRVATVAQCADDIISLWSELGTPQAQVDSQIVQFARESPEQLGLHQEDLKHLAAKRDKLIAEKQQREKRLKDLRNLVEGLWDRLGVVEAERKQFLAKNRGCGLRQINEFEDELARLNELKRQNLHIFVEDARVKLQELWDGLYFSEEEMLDFTPAFSDVYSDALLSAHEQEIARLEALREQRAPILAAIDKHRSLIQDKEELEKSSHDASRLTSKPQKGEKRDPGKLLREEKMRKRIAKELPKVEADLRRTLEAWEDEYGRPFCVQGQRYLDDLDEMPVKAAPLRSKTPTTLQPAREAPKSAGRNAGAQSQSRNGTVRGAPPPRSKTPTANPSRAFTGTATITNSSAAIHGGSKVSPSKIPGSTRLPMSNLRDGNNSPERRVHMSRSHTALGHHQTENPSSTVRGNMGPPRAPPPKMKDLFIPPTPTPTGGAGNGFNKENGSEYERSASVVRHAHPDDPYDDDQHHHAAAASSRHYNAMNSYHNLQPSTSHPRPTYHRADPSASSSISHHDPYTMSASASSRGGMHQYPVAPPSRQPSNTSSVMTGSLAAGSSAASAAGSENWETYTDNSEADEADATEAYYAKVKAQQMRLAAAASVGVDGDDATPTLSNKRSAAAFGAGMAAGAVKRAREQQVVQMQGQAVDGSDAGWTDDGDVGETF